MEDLKDYLIKILDNNINDFSIHIDFNSEYNCYLNLYTYYNYNSEKYNELCKYFSETVNNKKITLSYKECELESIISFNEAWSLNDYCISVNFLLFSNFRKFISNSNIDLNKVKFVINQDVNKFNTNILKKQKELKEEENRLEKYKEFINVPLEFL